MSGLTLKDVSREAGVSVAVVSAVLNQANGRIRASKETAERVHAAAAKLGYVPNNNARGLKMSRSFLIGVLSYAINTSFVPEILEGCEDFFLTRDYGMLLATYDTPEKFAANLETFRRRGIDGLLLISGGNPEQARMLESVRDIPKVSIAGQFDIPNCVWVRSDGAAIGRIAAAELLRRGHRELGYLNNNDQNRLAGWYESLRRNGVEPAPGLAVFCRNWLDEGVELGRKLLLEHPEVTAVFADSDIVGAAVLKVAREMNRRVAVIGVDDTPLCRMLTPELASIGFPKRAHGSLAADQLDRLLRGEPAENILLQPELKCRASLDV